jgi:hypothetical protein
MFLPCRSTSHAARLFEVCCVAALGRMVCRCA